LKGAVGDALHAISCAAGYNIRWLMRAIVAQAAKAAKAAFWAFSKLALYGLNSAMDALICRRRSKSEPPCRPNIEPGAQASFLIAGCG
jgi:hypothetical protein